MRSDLAGEGAEFFGAFLSGGRSFGQFFDGFFGLGIVGDQLLVADPFIERLCVEAIFIEQHGECFAQFVVEGAQLQSISQDLQPFAGSCCGAELFSAKDDNGIGLPKASREPQLFGSLQQLVPDGSGA